MPGFTTPLTDNYRVGKGVVSFKRTGASTFRDLGNVSKMQITFQDKRLDHFSSRQGVKKKDKSVIQEQAGEVSLTCDEWVPENLILAVMGGEVDTDTAGDQSVEIFAIDAIEGELKFTSHNDVGPKVDVDIYRVSFKPGKALDLISDGWSEVELVADLLARGSDGKFGLLIWPAS